MSKTFKYDKENKEYLPERSKIKKTYSSVLERRKRRRFKNQIREQFFLIEKEKEDEYGPEYS